VKIEEEDDDTAFGGKLRTVEDVRDLRKLA
jgi:hypothetical protein